MSQRSRFEKAQELIRVLIADENLLFRRGLRELLTAGQGIEVVGDAADWSELSAQIGPGASDVLLISLELLEKADQQPGFGIRQRNRDLKILALIHTDSPENLEFSVSVGARTYMLRSSSPADLIGAVRKLSAEGDSSSSDLQALAAQSHAASPNLLTSREQEVVRLLAEGRTVREVARDLSLSTKTIEAHKLNLMRKLNIHNRSSLVQYAVRTGMVTV